MFFSVRDDILQDTIVNVLTEEVGNQRFGSPTVKNLRAQIFTIYELAITS